MRLAALVTIASFSIVACGKRAGGSCKPGESTCLDKGKAVACQGGKFAEVACAGPLGCNKLQDHAICDDSVANEGDACMADADDEYACTPDKKRALLCKGGKFALHLECRGKGGCSLLGRSVSCDTSAYAAGRYTPERAASRSRTREPRSTSVSGTRSTIPRRPSVASSEMALRSAAMPNMALTMLFRTECSSSFLETSPHAATTIPW